MCGVSSIAGIYAWSARADTLWWEVGVAGWEGSLHGKQTWVARWLQWVGARRPRGIDWRCSSLYNFPQNKFLMFLGKAKIDMHIPWLVCCYELHKYNKDKGCFYGTM